MNINFETVKVYDAVDGGCKIEKSKIKMTAKPVGYSITRTIAKIENISGGMIYEITIPYKSNETDGSKVQAVASWTKKDGNLYARGYFKKTSREVLSLLYHVPENVDTLEIEYRFTSHGGGDVIFDMPQIDCKGEYKPRKARLATAWVNTHIKDRTLEDNLNEILRIADNAGMSDEKPDLLVFSETIYGRNVHDKTMAEKALKPDGPEIQKICEKAAKYKMYIVVGLMINDNGMFKNVALLIDRNGEQLPVYVKTHLTMGEIEAGIVPGNEIPVYDLDFGRIGIIICWDHYFSEPARILHQKGAEVIVIPSAGDTEHQSRTRAIESGAYVIMGGMHMPSSSFIMDPHGNTIATINDLVQGYISVEVDLNKRYSSIWMSVGPCLGEERDVFLNERRSDLYHDLSKEVIY